MQKTPTGVTIIATLHSFTAMILLIHVIISIPFIIVTFFNDVGLGFLSTFETIWDWILVSIHVSIAAALFARLKTASRMATISAGFGLIFGIISLLSGNMFAIFSIIMDGVVISYIRKPHVKAWLNKENI